MIHYSIRRNNMSDEKDVNVMETREENENGVKAVAPSMLDIREGKAYLKVGDVGNSVVSCRKLLNGKGYSCNTTNTTFDEALQTVVKRFQTAMGLTSDGNIGQATLAVLEDTQSATGWFQNGTIRITAGKLARMGFIQKMLLASNVKKLNDTCNGFRIVTKERVWHFLAQGMAETLKGTRFIEIGYTAGVGGNKDYTPYFGAGFLQLTGEANYKAFRQYMKNTKGVDDPKIVTPDVYATQYVAEHYPFESAGWYWDVYKDINKEISMLGGKPAKEVSEKVSRLVNGIPSAAEIDRRYSYYQKAKEIFQ